MTIIQPNDFHLTKGKKKRPEGRIKTDEKDNPWSRGKPNCISSIRWRRDHWMEEYLSKNRTNQGLQKPTETVFNGLTRLTSGCHRRATATMRQLTAPHPAHVEFKKAFKTKILSDVNPSIPFFGKHCCARRK
ncbi:hypothetical protein [Paraburkholderia hospita]|uniref:hypothetical protein n=1 Tax=Paraburkholderia hospita TaxID=169430 RepID=UPI0010558FA8|nr:hypothetical protein [Paraburkholderia hospita]